MNAEQLIDVLRKEYGINNERELDNAISRMHGINLSMFSSPFARMEKKDEKGESTYCNCIGKCVIS